MPVSQHIQAVTLETPETESPLSWDQLCKYSPELVILQSDARDILKEIPKDNHFWQQYESLKRRLKSCVGWYAHHGLPDEMRSTSAFETAYKEIFGGLV